MRCTPSRRAGAELGLATAETVVALPAIVLLVGGSLALPLALGAQLRATDAAREAARSAARGEAQPAVRAAAMAVDPEATVVVHRERGLVRVQIRVPVDVPLLHAWEVSATAVAADEADPP